MTQLYSRVAGWGAYVPPTTLTNEQLARAVDTSHEWIVQRTGIHERRVAGAGETTATMAVAAGRRALQRADLRPDEVDLIVVATSTPDHLTPPVSSQVQHKLGAGHAPAFVLTTGCTGFVYALATADQFIASGAYANILVIGVELLSRHIDWNDRATCVLFGDGAGAVVIQASEEPCGLLGFDLGSDGAGAEHIMAPAGGTAEPVAATTYAEGRQYIRMNGREVFRFATRVVGSSARRALATAGMGLADVDWIVPHQANLRIIQAAARDLGLPLDRFVINIDKYANTSAASIPIALSEALDGGRVKVDDRLLLASFGAGLTWASAVLQMAPAGARPLPDIGAGLAERRNGSEPVRRPQRASLSQQQSIDPL